MDLLFPPTRCFSLKQMYLPLGIDGIPDMVEAVPPKFAREIWKRLPRAPSSSSLPLPRVYVQLDPRYAFDIDLAVRQSLALVDLCVHKHQLPLPNLVIKIPGSWEGIQAAKVLERGEGEGGKEGGVRCLVTGVTSIVQAYAAAEAGVSYVAPYVGRVSDWEGREEDKEEGGAEERGVTLARDIQVLFKMRRWAGTLVMAASLRGIEQVKQLSGCDILTVSPQVMIALECAEPVLEEEEGGGEGLASFLPPVPSLRDLSLKSRRLLGMEGKGGKGREEGGEGGAPMTEAEFRTALAEDACGTAVFAKSMKTFIQVRVGKREGGGRAESPLGREGLWHFKGERGGKRKVRDWKDCSWEAAMGRIGRQRIRLEARSIRIGG